MRPGVIETVKTTVHICHICDLKQTQTVIVKPIPLFDTPLAINDEKHKCKDS